MFYYRIEDKVTISFSSLLGFAEISEKEAKSIPGMIYFVCDHPPERFRRCFAASDISLPFLEKEDIYLLVKPNTDTAELPSWLKERISLGQASVINMAYPKWRYALNGTIPDRWRVNIAGLGDVGGILLTGLRLLGGKTIQEIGIYDTDINKVNRWEYEANQILTPFNDILYPEVKAISPEQVFDCDIFVFCVSLGVPPVGQEEKDVRLAQFAGNSRVINHYAQMAREKDFQGIFAVVSDPVDLLCKSALEASNRNDRGITDYLGLAPEQIRGYGLGVMNARAEYFARRNKETAAYLREGRAYGPHGEGLIIANSIGNYDASLSEYLTEKARKANLDVRGFGYKPYVAPALSSGALSLLATMEGKWHYSATYMGGVYMGAKNRLTPAGTELERLDLPGELIRKLEEIYYMLGSYEL